MSKPTLDFRSLHSVFPTTSDYAHNYGWAAILSATLLGFGQERLIPDLVHEILIQTGVDEGLQAVAFRKVREAMLKASALVGFPRSINGLSLLHKTLTSRTPQVATLLSTDKSLRAPIPLSERHARGHAFFSQIYGKHTSTVLTNLNTTSGGDLGEYAVNCIYGDLVAEFAILDEKETTLLEFVCCLSIMAGPQAKGHMFGSRTLGNTGEEVRGAIEMCRAVGKAVETAGGGMWSEEEMDWLKKAEDW